MKGTSRVILLGLFVIGVFVNASNMASAQEGREHVLHDAATGDLRPAKVTLQPSPLAAPITKTMPFFSSGVLNAVRAVLQEGIDRDEQALGDESGTGDGTATGGQAERTFGCSHRTSQDNVRVNQDCTYRRQAEEKIVYNPANPQNLLAGANDSRVGFNQCSIAWSLDNGEHWGDQLPPFRQKLNNPDGESRTKKDPNSHTIIGGPGTFHTYDAASDPAPTFDSRGRGFFTCVAFGIASNAGMIYATQSPKDAQGSFFFNIDTFGRNFVVDEENDPRASLDKPSTLATLFRAAPTVTMFM